MKKPKFKFKIQKTYTLFSLRKRISALIIAISFLFCALLIRLSIVSLVDGKWLQEKAFNQWTRDLPITGERGKIYDTNGATLAVSKTTYDVYLRGRIYQTFWVWNLKKSMQKRLTKQFLKAL